MLFTLPNPTIVFVIPETVPVKVGDSIGAFRLILLDNDKVSAFCNRKLVSEVLNFAPVAVLVADDNKSILLDKVIVSIFCKRKLVSLFILLVNIVAVSARFNFKLILLDKVIVSRLCNKLAVSTILSFKFNSDCVELEIGLLASDVLSALPNPIMSLEIPVTIPVNAGEAIGAFKLILLDNDNVSAFCNK